MTGNEKFQNYSGVMDNSVSIRK